MMKFIVEGLNCANCAAKIEKKLNDDKRINEAELNFVSKTIDIQFARNTEKTMYLDIVKKIVKSYEPHTKVYSMIEYKQQDHKLFNKKEFALILLSILLYGISFFISKGQLVLLFSAYVLVGWDIIYTAFANIKKGDIFDEKFLMIIATFAAVYIGEYFEAVGVFIFFKLGEVLESYALEKSRKSISKTIDDSVKLVSYINPFDQKLITKHVDEIKIGDNILIKSGERVPFDGVLVSDANEFDPSALTGESLPVFRKKGEKILGGYINLNRPLKMKVDETYENSTFSKIAMLVDNASNKHSETEKMITKFARIYTPTVVSLAIAIVLIPVIFGAQDLNEWMYRGAIFLVVSCPCALVISIPLVYYIALGVAFKKGIIIKGSKYLDMIRQVDHFVFDKTGTLTKGEFEILKVTGDENTLMYAAIGEHYSTHPIGKAIKNAYEKEVEQELIEDYIEYPSKGITYKYGGRKIAVGNASFLKMESSRKNTAVHVSVDDKYIGSVYLQDKIKESAYSMIKSIEKYSKHVLSGDLKFQVEEVSKRLGIEEFRGEALPEEKLSYVEKLSSDGKVCFIGDGINDGPVLALSDVGISMGRGGSDIAIEQSKIVIIDDDIGKIKDLINLSKRVKNMVLQNVVIVLGI
ncbi:MAG: heavy metal translocating P-type ATPase, partial [Bacillota bacterium]|nr:heavy metal translocating P-type ATPase [Bacillota bacterium]